MSPNEIMTSLADLVTEAYRQPERCDELLPLTLPMSLQIMRAKGVGRAGRFTGVVLCAACKGQVSYDYNERCETLQTHPIPIHGCTCQRPKTMPTPDDIPYKAIEVTSRGDRSDDKIRWCEMAGEHEWVRAEDDDPEAGEYWCQVCGAYGQLVRPHGVVYP